MMYHNMLLYKSNTSTIWLKTWKSSKHTYIHLSADRIGGVGSHRWHTASLARKPS